MSSPAAQTVADLCLSLQDILVYLHGVMTKHVHRIFVQMQNSLSEQQYPVFAGWLMQLLQPDHFLYEKPTCSSCTAE